MGTNIHVNSMADTGILEGGFYYKSAREAPTKFLEAMPTLI